MANVLVIQRNAHLADAVRLEFVNGRDGQVAKATLTGGQGHPDGDQQCSLGFG